MLDMNEGRSLMTNRRLPRQLDSIRQEAKALRRSLIGGDPAALDRVALYFPNVKSPTLQQIQLVIAREYGFDSWSKLKARFAITDEDAGAARRKEFKNIPIVPLKDMVCYPQSIDPLFIGTRKSVLAVKQAWEHDPEKQILLVARKDPGQKDPGLGDLFAFGSVGTIMEFEVLDDGVLRIKVDVQHRARIDRAHDGQFFLAQKAQKLAQQVISQAESQSIVNSIISALTDYLQSSPTDASLSRFKRTIASDMNVPPNDIEKFVQQTIEQRIVSAKKTIDHVIPLEEPGRLIDTIASLARSLTLHEKQEILETVNLDERAGLLENLLEKGPDHYAELVMTARWLINMQSR